MKQDELNKILELHNKWLDNEPGGINANLSRANLSWANLSRANLSWANLSGDNLSGANLRFASLSGANLLIFQFNRNVAYYQFDGMIRIGCEYHSTQHWFDNYELIGRSNGYSELEIQLYGDFIIKCDMLENSKEAK